jgi:hypothetical protein
MTSISTARSRPGQVRSGHVLDTDTGPARLPVTDSGGTATLAIAALPLLSE